MLRCWIGGVSMLALNSRRSSISAALCSGWSSTQRMRAFARRSACVLRRSMTDLFATLLMARCVSSSDLETAASNFASAHSIVTPPGPKPSLVSGASCDLRTLSKTRKATNARATHEMAAIARSRSAVSDNSPALWSEAEEAYAIDAAATSSDCRSNACAATRSYHLEVTVLGLDACRGRWLAVVLEEGRFADARLGSTDALVSMWPHAAAIGVDVPSACPKRRCAMRIVRPAGLLVTGGQASLQRFHVPCWRHQHMRRPRHSARRTGGRSQASRASE